MILIITSCHHCFLTKGSGAGAGLAGCDAESGSIPRVHAAGEHQLQEAISDFHMGIVTRTHMHTSEIMFFNYGAEPVKWLRLNPDNVSLIFSANR